jgi:hypothetical protein
MTGVLLWKSLKQEGTTMTSCSWGIIKYAAGSGTFPETDVASFDGWYADRADAKAVFDNWRKQYPQWIVALVEQHEAHFGDGDFHGIRPNLEEELAHVATKAPALRSSRGPRGGANL